MKIKARLRRDWIYTGIAIAALVVTLIPLLALLIYVIDLGKNRLDWQAIVGLPPYPGAPLEMGGFGIALVGTSIMVGIGAAITIPLGILTAIYLSEFGKYQPSLTKIIRFSTSILSGIPTIVIGVFIYGTVVLATVAITQGRASFSAIAGGISLAVVALPIIIRTSEESLKLVAEDLRQAAFALGANPWQCVGGIVLPAAMPGIITGVLLAIARIAGETAPLLYTASLAQFPPRSLFAPTPALSVLIYNFATTAFFNQQQLAWTASLVLIFVILILSLFSRAIVKLVFKVNLSKS
jgi:phosphate transport system permease protein